MSPMYIFAKIIKSTIEEDSEVLTSVCFFDDNYYICKREKTLL